jgi:sugar phosphate isomerase/epimerase
MKPLLSALAAVLLAGTAVAAPYEFFPFDSGVGRDKPEWTPDRQASILKELGYSGIGYNYKGAAKLAEWQKAFDDKGLKIFSLYVYANLGQNPPKLDDALTLLKGRDTLIWLTIPKPKQEGTPAPGASPARDSRDEEAVQLIRKVCAEAKQYGINVVLYGHRFFYIETAEDALRLMNKAGCDNLFISMNLCHELASGNAERLGEIVKKCAPSLRLVSINGADTSEYAIPKSILRLDQGNFDVAAFVKSLKDNGYKGPIGLQCFQVPGDVEENLKADIGAWKKISAKVEVAK